MKLDKKNSFAAERCMKYVYSFYSPACEMPQRHFIMNTFVNGVFIAINKHSSPQLISFNFASSFTRLSLFLEISARAHEYCKHFFCELFVYFLINSELFIHHAFVHCTRNIIFYYYSMFIYQI